MLPFINGTSLLRGFSLPALSHKSSAAIPSAASLDTDDVNQSPVAHS